MFAFLTDFLFKGLVQFLAFWCEWRTRLQIDVNAIVTPHSGEVVRVECMRIYIRLFTVIFYVSGVLTSRTSLPTWARSNNGNIESRLLGRSERC